MVIKKFLFSEVTDLGIELTLKKKKKEIKTQTALS